MKKKLLPFLFTAVSAGCLAAPPSNAGDNGARSGAIVRQFAPAPAAPIDLTYQVAETVVAGQPITFLVTLNTSIESGDLQLKVTKQVGVTLIGDEVRHIDLADVARPIELRLTVIPTDQAQRSLVVVATIEVGGEQQSRSFRLSLPTNNPPMP